MIRRFCEFCKNEIPKDQRHYDINLDVIKSQDPEMRTVADRQSGKDFCYGCTKSGKALSLVFGQYERRLQNQTTQALTPQALATQAPTPQAPTPHAPTGPIPA